MEMGGQSSNGKLRSAYEPITLEELETEVLLRTPPSNTCSHDQVLVRLFLPSLSHNLPASHPCMSSVSSLAKNPAPMISELFKEC